MLPNHTVLAERWFMRPFAATLKDPVYWVPHRRGVLRGFALGLFINFIPLPIHFLLAPIAAVLLRVNIPVTVVSIFLINPLTLVPAFFTAYWIGCQLMHIPLEPFQFQMTWDWLQGHFIAIWKPLILGCLVLGALVAGTGYLALSLVWRLRVSYRYQSRPWKLRRKRSAFDQDSTL